MPREDFSALRLPREVVEAFPPNQTGLFDAFRKQTTKKMVRVVAKCDYGNEYEEHLAALQKLCDEGVTGPIGWNPNEVLSLFRWSGDYEDRTGLTQAEYFLTMGFCAAALTVAPCHNENRSLPGSDNIVVLARVASELEPQFDLLFAAMLTHYLESLEPWDSDYIDCAFGLTALCVLREAKPFSSQRQSLVDWFVRIQAEIVPWFTQTGMGIEPDLFGPIDKRWLSVLVPATSFAYVSDGVAGDRWRVLCDQVVAKWGSDDEFTRLVAEAGVIHSRRIERLNKMFLKDLPLLSASLIGWSIKRQVGEAAVRVGNWLMKFGGKKD